MLLVNLRRMYRFFRLGGRCTHHTISLSWMAFRRPSFKALSTHQTTGPHWPPAHPSETSVFLHWLIHVPVLHSSDSLWCLIPSWLCPPSVHGAARPVMNIQRSAYLTGLSLFSKPLGTILQPQKTHSMDLLLSRFVSLAFLYSLTPFCLCPHGLSLNILIHPIEEFICCCS